MTCMRRTSVYLRNSFARSSFSTSLRRRASGVHIVEVGPRDGLQNETKSIPLQTKLELIRRLSKTGIRNIEAGSFVAPKWVPQMANSAEILNHILGHPPPAPVPMIYNFLVPNLKGLENFIKASDSNAQKDGSAPITTRQDPNLPPTPSPSPKLSSEGSESAPIISSRDATAMRSETSGKNDAIQPGPNPLNDTSPPIHATEISIFTSATESFSHANTNCSIAESLTRITPIITLAKTHSLRVRGYISVALGCPYEGGNVSASSVASLTASLLEMGIDEVSVADTTGMGTAPKTRELLKTLFSAGIRPNDIALHFHDTYGQALVNTVVGLEMGVRTFDSSVAGLGGCPFSKGATGNVGTEDLVHLLTSLGVETGVDLEEMSRIGGWISGELGRPNESRAGKAILARLALSKS